MFDMDITRTTTAKNIRIALTTIVQLTNTLEDVCTCEYAENWRPDLFNVNFFSH